MRTEYFRILLGLGIMLMLFSGCGKRKIFEQSEKFPDYSWNRFKYLYFDAPINDTAGTYDIMLYVRHATQYPYRHLDVNFTSYTPSGEERSMDYNFMLRDENNKFLGDGLGDLWDIELPLRLKTRFPEKGTYKFEIENKTTKFETPGILEVGVVVRRSRG